MILTLHQVRADLEADIAEIEGMVISGPTISAYLGKLAACVDAVAGILSAHLSEQPGTTPPKGD